MFFQVTLVFFEVFVEHVFSAQLIPASKMVNFHGRKDSGFFEDPINLFLVTPHKIPVIVIGLSPLPGVEALQHAVSEIGFKLDVGPRVVIKTDTVGLGNAPFLCSDGSIMTFTIVDLL